MAEVLFEKFRNLHGIAWIRTHGTNHEYFALCSTAIHPEVEGISIGTGEITCPDCVEVIKRCKDISESDLAPEYANDLFLKRVNDTR